MSILSRMLVAKAISRDEKSIKYFFSDPNLLSPAGQQALTLYEQHLRVQANLTSAHITNYLSDACGLIVWYELSFHAPEVTPMAFTPQMAATSTLIQYAIFLQHNSQTESEVRNTAFALQAITPSILFEYLGFLQTRLQMRPGAFNSTLESLKYYFAWAIQNRLISSDPSLTVQPLPIDPLKALYASPSPRDDPLPPLAAQAVADIPIRVVSNRPRQYRPPLALRLFGSRSRGNLLFLQLAREQNKLTEKEGHIFANRRQSSNQKIQRALLLSDLQVRRSLLLGWLLVYFLLLSFISLLMGLAKLIHWW